MAGGEKWKEAGQGKAQGEPDASPFFCTAIHPHVKAFHAELVAAGGLAIFGNDDGYAAGPPEILFPALERFAAAAEHRCALKLQRSKTAVYHQSGLRPPHTPPDLPLAGVMVDNVWHPGFTCYGVEIGSSGYIRHMLGERLSRLKEEVDNLMALLKDNNQAAWVVLSSSLAQTLDYSLTLQYPSDILEVSRDLDARLWTAFEQLAGQPRIPRGNEGLGFECMVARGTGVAELEDRTYQHLMAAQPIKLGGCGLRSTEETRYAAFVGGVEMALPFLVEGDHGEEVLCPQLEQVIGRVSGQDRWSTFLEAGSRTSEEFQQAWAGLTSEASSIFTYLQEEPTGPLSVPVAEAGGTSTDGSTRTKVVHQKEMLRYKLMSKALSTYPDRDSRT